MHTSAHHDRTATAYHEAAHMAVACHYNLPVGPVTIHAEGTDRPHTHPALPLETAIPSRADDSFQTLNVITCLVAGAIAEERYTGGDLDVDVASGDHEQAWRLAIQIADTDRAAEALMNWLTIRAEQDVNRCWNEITAIAALLLETGQVTPEQARAAGREADRRRAVRTE
jgi:ATP-dependent Zn protease